MPPRHLLAAVEALAVERPRWTQRSSVVPSRAVGAGPPGAGSPQRRATKHGREQRSKVKSLFMKGSSQTETTRAWRNPATFANSVALKTLLRLLRALISLTFPHSLGSFLAGFTVVSPVQHEKGGIGVREAARWKKGTKLNVIQYQGGIACGNASEALRLDFLCIVSMCHGLLRHMNTCMA